MKRNTRQREVLREILEKAGRPLSPIEIAEAARHIIPAIGMATVYRAIKEMISEKWVSPVEVAGGTRYERAGKGHHHHFYCGTCDRTFDIDACAGDLQQMLPRGFVMTDHELTIRGRCRGCTAGAERQSAS